MAGKSPFSQEEPLSRTRLILMRETWMKEEEKEGENRRTQYYPEDSKPEPRTLRSWYQIFLSFPNWRGRLKSGGIKSKFTPQVISEFAVSQRTLCFFILYSHLKVCFSSSVAAHRWCEPPLTCLIVSY